MTMKKVSGDLAKNRDYLDRQLGVGESFDVLYRNVEIGKKNAALYMIDGFCKDEVMQKLLQHFIGITKEQMPEDAAEMSRQLVPYGEVDLCGDLDEICRQVMSGVTALLLEGYEQGILIDARTYPARSVGEPEKDKVLRGSKDGFVETIVFNTALIRRRIRSTQLRMEMLQAGKTSHTDIVLCYMEDRVDQQFLEKIRNRIQNLQVDALTLNQESLGECLYQGRWWNPFPKFRFSERPDTAAAQVLEGNIIILVDNSPSALITPTSLFDVLEEADDYYFPPITGTYLRLSRLLIAIVTYFLTPTFLLLMEYPQWIPKGFEFIAVRDTVYIPLIWQLLLLELAIDGLKLAAVNTPNMLSTPLSVKVALGYTAEMAVNEAKRCIGCKNKPCQSGCPVGIDIPEFIAHVAEGDFEAAYQVINRSSSLPAVCGRVCPQESQCEGKCTRGIKNEPVAIGRLERFVADWHRENVHTAPIVPEWNGHKVAVIGAGPAGLTAAGDLAKLGYKVTVYEALHVAGGVLMYGIPEFRLPKAIVQQEIDGLKKMGVDFECNMVIGKVLTIDELMGEYGYEAVFVGSGAGLPRFMNIPGESLKGVYSANEFLTRSNLMKAYLPTSKTPIRTGKKVAVVGGGNVAMDAARSALRLGAESVYIVYRRGMAELPARKEEVEHAEEEGIIFKTLCNPVAIHPDEDGFVHSMTCIEMELGEPDASGRRRPIEKPGSEFELEVDTVIMSLGTSPNPLIRSTTPGLETNKHGCIVTEGDEGKTSRDGVYAGGDAVTGAATVIKAMGAGKAAAKAMDEYIRNK